jgi:plastocyanin
MSIRRARPAAALAAVVLTLALLMPSFASAATFVVRAREVSTNTYRWRPARLEVAKGSKVVWRIVDGTHNVNATSNNWNKSTGNLVQGSKTAFTFKRNGTYRYRCTLHSSLSDGKCSGMCGKVVVG